MYVNRPSSSKGRVRPATAQRMSVDLCLSPRPPASGRPTLRSRSDRSSDPDEASDRAPDEPVSLNRYRVLPSIQKKSMGHGQPPSRGEMDHTAPEGSDPLRSGGETDHTPQESDRLRSGGETDHTAPEGSDPLRSGRETDHTAPEGSELLLAIRTRSGQRFRAVFRPAERLQALLSAAEAEFGQSFGQATIETMDVPRRTFTDLSLTLAQCGVLHKSLLCIGPDTHA